MMRTKIQILFNVCADADNFNAQSLSARDLALRLDPQRFNATVFYETEPDPRLPRCSHLRLVKRPRRLRTFKILMEMLREHDVIFYIDSSPSSYLYLHLPKFMRRSTISLASVEGLIEGNQRDISSGFVRLYSRYVFPRCDVRTAITEFVAQDVETKLGIRPQFVIPVGVDTQVFTPPSDRKPRTPTVLFVGHLIERKGPHLVLEAAHRMPDICFRLIGAPRGDFYKILHRMVDEWHLENVTFDAYVSESQLIETMRHSDIFLLPSRVEGMPKVTLEAAATGLPCIVFDDYQTPSVVNGVTGFQATTFEEMLDRLQLLIENRELCLQMGAAAVEHVKQFDWDIIADQWENVFEDLVRR